MPLWVAANRLHKLSQEAAVEEPIKQIHDNIRKMLILTLVRIRGMYVKWQHGQL
jgi:hypothetical protein